MTYPELIIRIIEIIGTVAFASSGALIGIRKNMDIFGVNVLGVTTAVGGGMVRDLLLGNIPPMMFRNPLYVMLSILTSCLLFIVVYLKKKVLTSELLLKYERIMTVLDAVGLGAFTAIGINTAISMGYGDKKFLLIFVGVMTGVGGGMLRDIMAGQTPFVLVRHVYASASIIGAICCIVLRYLTTDIISLVIGALVVVIIRCLAAYYRWNLPKINI